MSAKSPSLLPSLSAGQLAELLSLIGRASKDYGGPTGAAQIAEPARDCSAETERLSVSSNTPPCLVRELSHGRHQSQ